MAQTYTDYEIIVIDDGSSDNTSEIVRKLEGPIRYFFQHNRGPAAARNIGIKEARGRFIAFLDADDLWEPSKLDRQIEYLALHPEFGLVYSDLEVIDQESKVIRPSKFQAMGFKGWSGEGWIFDKELLENFISASTVLVRKEVLDDVGTFNEALLLSETTDLFIRITQRYQVGCIRRQLVKRRMHDGNLTKNFNETGLRSGITIVARHLETLRLRPLTKVKVRRRLGGLYRRLARYDLGQGRRQQARAEFLASLTAWPIINPAVIYLPLTYAPASLVGWLKQIKDR